MTVQEMIEELRQFPASLQVTITDGHEGVCYHTNRAILTLQDDHGEKTVDIGIGGLNISEE